MNVLAIDQGTSATKALLVGPGDEILGRAEVPVTVRSTSDGGAETDPAELLASVLAAGAQALAVAGAPALTASLMPRIRLGVGLDVLHDDDDLSVWTLRDGVPDRQTVRRKMQTVGAR